MGTFVIMPHFNENGVPERAETCAFWARNVLKVGTTDAKC